jgi:hypothetical protein
MKSVREVSKSKKDSESWSGSATGKLITAAVCIAAVSFSVFEVRSYLHGSTPGDPNTVMFVDSETGQSFPHRSVVGESIPVVSPFTSRNTGYPGSPCYWTASGEIRTEPYWLLMNEQVGKFGPTFCPDCGRLFIPRRPIPKTGDRPPPTRDELLHANPAALSGSKR